MIDYFAHILALPPLCVEHSPMPKNFYERNFKLAAADTKVLKVPYLPLRMTWLASIKPANTSIPEYVTEQVAYSEVQVFVIQIRADHYTTYASKMLHLVHKYIPYHSMVIVHDEQRYQISTSSQSIHQAAADKRVLDEVYISPICSLSIRTDIQSRLEQQIRFDSLPHVNLQTLYSGYSHAIIRARGAEAFGMNAYNDDTLATDIQQLWAAIRKAKQDEAKISALKEKIRKAKTVQDKVALQMELREIRLSIQYR